jgi:GNAT superfamily N-acetyltransferase
MPRLVTADAYLIERILDGTHALWSEGLSRSDYSRWQKAQMDSAWGQRHLRRVALVDGDELLSSAKRYDLIADIGGGRLSVLGIGAVFTPLVHRGRGHARHLIEALTTAAGRAGCRVALLFSEIGPAYYKSMGFEVVRRDEVAFEAAAGHPRIPGARSGDATDLPAMAELGSRTRLPSGLTLGRSADFIDFGLVRRGTLAALSAPGRFEVEWLVVEDAGRLAAYLIATRRPRGLVIEDCADVDPTGARVSELVASLLARPSFHPPIVHGWLPEAFRGWTCPALWRAATDPIMMIKPIGDAQRIAITPPVTYWNLDVF